MIRIPTNAPTRATDPETSLEAAETVNVTQQAHTVLAVYWYAEKLIPLQQITDSQLVLFAQQLGYKDSAQGLRSRRATLTKHGYIHRVDHEGTSPTGRHASRYQLTQQGIAYCTQQARGKGSSWYLRK